MKLYYYGPQRVAVQVLLGQFLDPRHVQLQAVHEPDQLFGLEDVNFVYIPNHPHMVGAAMREVLQRQGCIIWTVSDAYTRTRRRQSNVS